MKISEFSRLSSIVDIERIMKYVTLMSSSRILKVSYLKKNVTNFLKRYENLYKDYKLSEVKQFRKLSRYCKKIINDSIKIMKEFSNDD